MCCRSAGGYLVKMSSQLQNYMHVINYRTTLIYRYSYHNGSKFAHQAMYNNILASPAFCFSFEYLKRGSWRIACRVQIRQAVLGVCNRRELFGASWCRAGVILSTRLPTQGFVLDIIIGWRISEVANRRENVTACNAGANCWGHRAVIVSELMTVCHLFSAKMYYCFLQFEKIFIHYTIHKLFIRKIDIVIIES